MLTVETVGRIRRGHFRGKSIKALSRELRVSRNTVRRILRAEECKRCGVPTLPMNASG